MAISATLPTLKMELCCSFAKKLHDDFISPATDYPFALFIAKVDDCVIMCVMIFEAEVTYNEEKISARYALIHYALNYLFHSAQLINFNSTDYN